MSASSCQGQLILGPAGSLYMCLKPSGNLALYFSGLHQGPELAWAEAQIWAEKAPSRWEGQAAPTDSSL